MAHSLYILVISHKSFKLCLGICMTFCLLQYSLFTEEMFATSTKALPTTSQPLTRKANATVETMNATTTAANRNTTTETNWTVTEETTTTKAPNATTMPLHKYQNLCENYATIVDDSRLFSNPVRENKCDFYFKKAVRFMSSDGGNLQLKEKCNDEDVNEFRYYCGGSGLTYLEQLHPNKSDVPTVSSVCMKTFFAKGPEVVGNNIPRPDCKCNSRQNILVQNCSGFYVYQLLPISHVDLECPARYCTEELRKFQFYFN